MSALPAIAGKINQQPNPQFVLHNGTAQGLKVPVLTTPAEIAAQKWSGILEFTLADIQALPLSVYQRDCLDNTKVVALSKFLPTNGGCIEGTLHIVVRTDLGNQLFIVDGQHRIRGFVLSGLPLGYAEFCFHFVGSGAAESELFETLNEKLRPMKPDHTLKAREARSPELQRLRQACPFLGFSGLRKGPNSPIISMSVVVRTWRNSASDPPSTSGIGAKACAVWLDQNPHETDNLIKFLDHAITAWGRDKVYSRLWGHLNITVCMWAYRRMVLTPPPANAKYKQLTDVQFVKCLMHLGAKGGTYLDWLASHSRISKPDRGPCYNRIREIFGCRIKIDTNKKWPLPSPGWAS